MIEVHRYLLQALFSRLIKQLNSHKKYKAHAPHLRKSIRSKMNFENASYEFCNKTPILLMLILLYSSITNNISGRTMKRNSIIFNLVCAILCGFATPAAADFCGQNYSDCCEWSVGDGKMTLGADWLYWKVQQDGIRTGTISVETPSDAPVAAIATRAVRPNFKYDSGFRVNLGYELPCDCWDINVAYTYIPSHAKTSSFAAESDLESFTPAIVLGDFAVDSFTTFRSKWDFNANNVDLDIGRTVSFGECLKVRPHVGVRATWYDQKYRYFGTSPIVDSEAIAGTALSLKEKFQGYGVEAGLWGDWKLGCGISLVGHFGGSILYSRYEVKSAAEQGLIVEDDLVAPVLSFTKDKIYTATPTVDYFIGLQYADCFCDMMVKAHVGWEQHVLFDTNRFLSAGNLSTQGLTLGLEVGF